MRGSLQVPAGVREGDILVGKYRVERILGSGGMGVVVAARHLKLDERVAIKLLVPDAFSDPEALVRFDREARAAVKIKSQHVARVTDVGTLENGSPYMVMEYLEGEDMAECLRRMGPLPVERTVDLVLQACEAIGEAHAIGIIHRDLKPANLFCARGMDDQCTIKVLDFGISKLTSLAATTRGLEMTRTGAMIGSPLYMSPEQMQTPRNVDTRTDIWGIGIVLYELLTGEVPFHGETVPEVCFSVASEPTPSMRRLRPDVSPGLDAVIAKCLEKNRNQRFSTVGELALALAPFGSERAHSSAARTARVSASAAPTASSYTLPPPLQVHDRLSPRSATDSSWGNTNQRSAGMRRRSSVFAVGTIAAIALSAGLAAWMRPSSDPGAQIREAAPSSIAPATTAGTVDLAPPKPTSTAPPGQPEPTIPLPSPGAKSQLASPAVAIAEERPRDRSSPPARAANARIDRSHRPTAATASSGGDAQRPVARPESPPQQAESPSAHVSAPTCVITITSVPTSKVALDGVPLGTTPLLGVSASSGTPHKLVFSDSEGGEKMTTVTCRPGEIKRVAVRLSPSPVLDGPAANPYK